MHVMGKGRYGRETYPSAFAGASAVAQMPFAQLGLSGDAPFTEAVDTGIPFDTIVYESASFGVFETHAGVSALFVPFGVYLVTLQLEVSTEPTELDAAIVIASGSGEDQGLVSSVREFAALTVSGVRLGSETPFPGHSKPVIILPTMVTTGGGNGNIVAEHTKLFVWQLTRFQAATP